MELLEASHTSTSIYCKFRQNIAPDEAAQTAYIPDLNRTYYLLLAYGKTNKHEGEKLVFNKISFLLLANIVL